MNWKKKYMRTQNFYSLYLEYTIINIQYKLYRIKYKLKYNNIFKPEYNIKT